MYGVELFGINQNIRCLQTALGIDNDYKECCLNSLPMNFSEVPDRMFLEHIYQQRWPLNNTHSLKQFNKLTQPELLFVSCVATKVEVKSC